MKTASISEAKNRLSALIDAVKAGESVLILDRGRPVARLGPVGVQAEGGDEEARVADLERAGLVRRAARAASERPQGAPPRVPGGASALAALLDERAEGR